MLIELTSTKTVEGVGFKLENAQIDGIRIVEILDPSLVKLRIGDVLLSLCGVGLRGLSFADVKAKLDALTNGATFGFSVGRKPTETDLRDYDGPTKEDLRKKIWDKLEKDDIADFPRPCHHRIPNFKGSKGACDRLLSLPAFNSAKTVKINPDKPQQHARYLTLQQRKKLLVPTPRLRSGLFNHMQPPEGATTEDLKKCCTAQGVKEFGIPIPLESKLHVDLVVIGSVVVSTRGFRIGKGEGFADMEWAMMASTGAVGPETVIVTVVHDEQILDIPTFLVDSHDMTVDFILTPTRLLECHERLPRPKGIIWEKLTQGRIEEIPILKKIMEIEKAAGRTITLKREEDTYGRREPSGNGIGGERTVNVGRGRGRGRGAQGGGGDGTLCFNCQSPGHWARDCPQERSERNFNEGGYRGRGRGGRGGGRGQERGENGFRGRGSGLSRTIRGGEGRGRGGRGRGRGGGSTTADLELRCFKCDEIGHYARDCFQT